MYYQSAGRNGTVLETGAGKPPIGAKFGFDTPHVRQFLFRAQLRSAQPDAVQIQSPTPQMARLLHTHTHQYGLLFLLCFFLFLNGAGPLPERIFGPPGSCRWVRCGQFWHRDSLTAFYGSNTSEKGNRWSFTHDSNQIIHIYRVYDFVSWWYGNCHSGERIPKTCDEAIASLRKETLQLGGNDFWNLLESYDRVLQRLAEVQESASCIQQKCLSGQWSSHPTYMIDQIKANFKSMTKAKAEAKAKAKSKAKTRILTKTRPRPRPRLGF